MTVAHDPCIDPTAEMNQPPMVWAELRDHLEQAITSHPRSQQKRIGPSEIGEPCTRALARKINGDEEPPRLPALKPQIGTWGHDGMERVMRAANQRYGTERYLLEQKVSVGDINGTEIIGSCDLFDVMTGVVVDWKFLGKTSLNEMRRKGAKAVYRIQSHLYGRGWQRRGYDVRHVMVVGIPRDGEITQCTTWHEPYSEQIALDALARATAVAQLVSAIGIDATVESYPPCDDHWCAWCPKQRAFSTQPQPPVTSTASLFASA